MRRIYQNASVITEQGIIRADIVTEDGRICAIAKDPAILPEDEVIPCDNFFVTPGLIDVHVHFREPGFEYKETIKTGAEAAIHGGYQAVCPMPNLSPAPFTPENLEIELKAINDVEGIDIVPYGRITKDGEELADMEELAPYVCAFSDDGKGVQGKVDMRVAMREAKELGKLIVAHCEDEHYDTYDPRSEYLQVMRDIELAEETGAGYHVCHVSTKESVRAIREAKARGVDVTCETAPHYLVFNNEDLPREGKYKMNPPIRTEADRQALLEGIMDGTVDMIVTDHAPHSREEKAKGFDSLFGIIGVETAFPVMYTKFVETGFMTLEHLMELMCGRPSRRFGIGREYLKEGQEADFYLFDLDTEYIIDPETFRSKGRSTPFEGWKVRGRAVKKVWKGEVTDLL